MVLMTIETLVMGTPPSPSVLVLSPLDKGSDEGVYRVLPIWIGTTEAASIGMALEEIPHSRPLTHDLLISVIDEFDASIEYVLIERMEGTTFFATLVLTYRSKTVSFDARPSDAIALAVRSDAPIYVDETVFDSASLPYVKGPAANRKEELEAFHEFIQNVSPEDFDTNI